MIKLDRTRLLGFRLAADTTNNAMGGKLGGKQGSKLGIKAGLKVGLKPAAEA